MGSLIIDILIYKKSLGTDDLLYIMTERPQKGLREPEKASSLVTFALGSILAGFLLGVGMTVGENMIAYMLSK